MSRWTDQFESHQIHQTLSQLESWLDVDLKEIDATHQAEKRRLTKSIATIKDAINGLDGEFFPDLVLNQINQHLRQAPIWNNLSGYHSHKSSNLLVNANDHLNSIIPQVFQVASLAKPIKVKESVKSIESAIDSFCQTVSDRQREIERGLEDISRKLSLLADRSAQIEVDFDNLRRDLSISISNWQSEHTAAQSDRAELFSKSQIERSNKYDETLRDWNSKLEKDVREVVTTYSDKLTTEFTIFNKHVEEMLLDMNSKHEAIRAIHGLVGTDGVAGGYQKSATDEKKSANNWRATSVAFLVAAAAWLLTKYLLGFETTWFGRINWPELMTAASLTLVLLAGAGYAARQSKIHRTNEHQMHWFALEVKAIDPFISSLPIDEQHTLKTQLSEKLFGKDRQTTTPDRQDLDLSVLKTLNDHLSSLLKLTGKS